MSNLLHETINMLTQNGKNIGDVRWVGSKDLWFSFDDFARLADKQYDDGFGGAEVAQDMVVVGDSWWLERHEYDGSEWWEFKSLPTKPSTRQVPQTVIRRSYESSLLEMTKEEV